MQSIGNKLLTSQSRLEPLETWNQFLSPKTALPVLDQANTERRPPYWGYIILCKLPKREIANRLFSEVRSPWLSQVLSHLRAIWLSTQKTFLGSAAYWETKAQGFVTARTTSIDTLHRVKNLLLKLLFYCVPTLFCSCRTLNQIIPIEWYFMECFLASGTFTWALNSANLLQTSEAWSTM